MYSFGFVLIFFQQKFVIHNEIYDAEANGETKDLKVFSFKKSEVQHSTAIHWLDKDEFSINNEQYDIVKVVTKGDSIQFYCVHDVKEEALLSGFFSLLDQNQSKDHLANRLLKQILNNLVLCGFLENSLQLKPEIHYTFINYKIQNFYRIIQPEITSPPPEA